MQAPPLSSLLSLMQDDLPSGTAAEEEVQPVSTYYTILEREVAQAVSEFRRPAMGLFMSGLLAGLGLSLLLVAAVLIANAYAAGFVVVIMGRTDLFTEYTTLASARWRGRPGGSTAPR